MEKSQQMIAVEPDVTIVVRAHGNLDVQGWDRPEVGIITDINVQKIRQEKNLLRLLFVEDCEISAPRTATIVVERVSDNTRLRNIEKGLIVQRVQGKLALQNVHSAKIERVADDCLLENTSGEIIIGKIGGNLQGKKIGGPMKVDRVSGRVSLHNLHARVELRADDTVEVSLAEGNLDPVGLRSSDNILLHLPPLPNVSLQVKSSGEHVEIHTAEYKKKITESRCEARLGDGRQKIVLEAGNRVRVTEEVLDEKEIARLFEELDLLWLRLKEESSARQAAREGKVNWEIRMVDGAARAATDAMEGVGQIAGQITEETIQQAEAHVKDALKRVEEQIRNLGYEIWVEDEKRTETEEISEVTQEEKLIIMRLLQQQKISVEEADRLLEVLSEVSKKRTS